MRMNRRTRSLAVLMVLIALFLCGCHSQEFIYDDSTAGSVCTTEPTILQTYPAATEPIHTTPPETIFPEETTIPTVVPQKDEFVLVTQWIPDLIVDLKYASEDNFTGTVIYEFQDAYLRYGTVCKLTLVQQELQSMGLGLKLWDGFRPPKAQYRLWEICPDPVYVSDPNKGFSNHSRGDTVDITLVDSQGRELEMPSGFDDFSELADRDYSDCTPEAAANAMLLQQIMEKYGFTGYRGEWWHYMDDDDYPVEMDLLSEGKEGSR